MFDHLMVVTADLDGTVAAFERRLGVRAAFGGQHEGLGTHNALLGLGERRYLEILAPVPGHETESPFAELVAGFAEPRAFLWAVRVQAIAAFVREAQAAGYDPGTVMDMARTTPEGQNLQWQLTMGGADVMGGVVPFGIQWSGTVHPADTAPAGCTFVGLRAEHPEPARITAALEALRVDLSVESGNAPALVLTLDTPNGRVEIR